MGMRSKSRSRKAAAGNALSGVQAALELVFRAIGHVAQIPAVVAGLSLLMPGLGHVAIHKFRRGAIVALPALAVTFVVLLLVIFDRSALFQIVSAKVLTSLLLLDLVALVYHLWAMADGYMMAAKLRPVRPGATRWLSAGAVAVLVLGTVTIHAGLASVNLQTQQTLNCVMNANGPCIADYSPGDSIPSFDMGIDSPDPSTSVAPDPTDTPAPSGSAAPTPGDTTLYPVPPACTDPSGWAARNCTLYILLIGGDAGIGRPGGQCDPTKPNCVVDLRTDTMIVLQVDLSTGRSAMYSIPRNLMNVPLGKTDWNAYPYHFFPALRAYGASSRLGCGNTGSECIIDYMWHDAAFVNPGKYPYPGNYFARATKAVEESIGALMGVPMSGTVVVDLLGFVNLIDALAPNGLKINSPYDVRQIPGSPYTNSVAVHQYGLHFPKGVQTLHGEMALAFARLRHVVAHDSDTYRTARQQLVLSSLLDQLNPCEIAPNITSVLGAVKGTIWTNMDWNDAPQLAAVAAKIHTSNLKTYQLNSSRGYAANVTPDVGSTAVLQKYQNAVKIGLNGASSAYGGGSSGGGNGGGNGGGGFHC